MPAGEPEHDVVVNNRGQYSLWRVGKALPEGWQTTGFTGTEAQTSGRSTTILALTDKYRWMSLLGEKEFNLASGELRQAYGKVRRNLEIGRRNCRPTTGLPKIFLLILRSLLVDTWMIELRSWWTSGGLRLPAWHS
jgi:hypothetical protein